MDQKTEINSHMEQANLEASFAVDTDRKNLLYKKQCRQKVWPQLVTKGLWIIAALFTVIFLAYGFMTDTFVIADPTDSAYGQLNIALMITSIATVDVILVFLSVIGNLMTKGMVGKETICRINESLSISEDNLIYGYQNLTGAADGDRIEVTIPLEGASVSVDEKTSEITITGAMRSMYYENYRAGKTHHDGSFKDGTFVLYDYFTPSLADAIYRYDKEKKRLAEIRIREEEKRRSYYEVSVRDILRVAVTKKPELMEVAYVIWAGPDGIYITGLQDRVADAARFKRRFIETAQQTNQFTKVYTRKLCDTKEGLQQMSAERIDKEAYNAYMDGAR